MNLNEPSSGDAESFTESTVEEVVEYFASRQKKIVTLAGFSGLGYQNTHWLRSVVRKSYLKRLKPEETIINIGVTPDGIGIAYKWAAKMGFETSGIVSNQALKYAAPVSTHLKQNIFFVKDDGWGGYLQGTTTLSPTSEAMVSVSDSFIAFGGGEVTRDEILEMQRLGKETIYIPAEMNHRKAIEKAKKNGKPKPEHYFGSLVGKVDVTRYHW